MKCFNCGNKIDENESFCKLCSKRIDSLKKYLKSSDFETPRQITKQLGRFKIEDIIKNEQKDAKITGKEDFIDNSTGKLSQFISDKTYSVKKLLEDMSLNKNYFSILVNGKRADLAGKIKRGDTIIILPKFCGGMEYFKLQIPPSKFKEIFYLKETQKI